MVDIVIATGNWHKVRELKALLRLRGIRWRSLVECPPAPPVHETGRTFDANAVNKARAIANATGYPALADDSGLEVEALGGAPGVRSARFSGSHGDDRANNDKLLRLLDGLPAVRRRARYRCSLAFAQPSGAVAITRGVWQGRIANEPRGVGGFGYDPIFLLPRLGRTVAELPRAVKRRASHRAIAARRMRRVLQRWLWNTRPRPAAGGIVSARLVRREHR